MTDEEQFYALLDKMKEIHDAKRHDYASTEDRFSNLMLSELMGIPAWKGCLVRISDKFSRLTEFAKKEQLRVKDESIEDTFLDMANYALIGIILYRRANTPIIREPKDLKCTLEGPFSASSGGVKK